MIDKNLIVKGGSFQNYEEAIKFGGRLLYENGYVDSGYTDSVLEREAQFPTGLPTQGVPMAIPHTDSEHVLKSMFCLVVFSKPVMFRQMGDTSELIPAEIMVMLAIDGGEKHLKFLSNLIGLFSDGSVLTRIKAAEDAGSICRILKEFEQFNLD